jgi:NADPH-dependent 2,4-dienoyl-CoA reductase/sulfur reductase-like enzyme
VTAPYVIVGGDAAGMTAASKIKRTDPDADVIVFERGPYISYSACGMPYWISGVVSSDRQLILLTPEIARKRRHIDVRNQHEVTALDPAAKTVAGVNQATGQPFTQAYEKLLIATGARAVRPSIAGLDLPGVFTMRSLVDAQAIQAFLEAQPRRHAVIIGGGYIGVEMAEAFRARELDVQMIELLPRIMPHFDADMIPPVLEHLQQQGVGVHTATRVAAIAPATGGLAVQTDVAGDLPADIVLVATGVAPNSELAAAAGLRLGDSGAIWVDTFMQTSHPDIYAAGDCVAHRHLVLGRDAFIPLATSANKGGRVAADNMCGERASLPGILGTAVVKVFDYTMSSTGINEEDAKASGLFGADGEFVGSATIENADRAGYWPGAETLHVKLVFDRRDGRVVGGQLVGKAGVNKRIDIVAAAITARMTVTDLAVLDLSYSPPYSPTHDPIQICANVAQREVMGTPAAG